MLVSSHSDRCDTKAPNTNAVAGSEVARDAVPRFSEGDRGARPELVDDLSKHVLALFGTWISHEHGESASKFFATRIYPLDVSIYVTYSIILNMVTA
jgi:hypothetical protein